MKKERKHLYLIDQDEIERQAKKETLLIEANSFGYALDLELSVEELTEQINDIRQERKGKPPCYKRSFKFTSPYCKICELNIPCGIDERKGGDNALYGHELDAEICDSCKMGYLQIELIDEKTREVRNYACSSPGCFNTLLDQRRFIPVDTADQQKTVIRRKKEAENKISTNVKIKPKQKRKVRNLDIEKAKKLVLQYMQENNGHLENTFTAYNLLGVSKMTAVKILDEMVKDGKILKLLQPGKEHLKRKRYFFQLV